MLLLVDGLLHFEVAQKEKFVEQLKWADVVYLCGSSGGGATERLLGVLKQFDNLKHIFDGKIVAGESAGALTGEVMGSVVATVRQGRVQRLFAHSAEGLQQSPWLEQPHRSPANGPLFVTKHALPELATKVCSWH